jgi:hypothetical protein
MILSDLHHFTEIRIDISSKHQVIVLFSKFSIFYFNERLRWHFLSTEASKIILTSQSLKDFSVDIPSFVSNLINKIQENPAVQNILISSCAFLGH